MSIWKRATQEIPFESLHPEIKDAISKHIEQYDLGAILSETLMCVQTDSEKAKKGLFGQAETVYTGVVLTPRWLIWGTSGSKAHLAVLSAQLRNLTVQDYAQTPFMKMVPDSGMEVSGPFTDTLGIGSVFIGLDDAVGKKFRETVIQAVQTAKK
jgi:hypothetical protein